MHYRVYSIVALLFLSLLASCTKEESSDDAPKTYYDLKGFIENQIVDLNNKKPEITKTAGLGNKQEVSKTRDVDWKKELELFVQADINKSSYRQSYEILHNGPLHYEYKLKAGNDLPVQYVNIEVDSALKQPLHVEATIRSKNKIYESEKKIVLHSAKRDNLLGVTGYSVSGYQQLAFMDKKVFRIESKIGL